MTVMLAAWTQLLINASLSNQTLQGMLVGILKILDTKMAKNQSHHFDICDVCIFYISDSKKITICLFCSICQKKCEHNTYIMTYTGLITDELKHYVDVVDFFSMPWVQ